MKSVKIYMFILLFPFILSCGDENRETPEVAGDESVETQVSQAVEDEDHDEEWDYENTDWEGENECKTAVQSPVDIDTSEVIEARLGEVTYQYEPFTMDIVDNGHTVQVSGSDDNYISVAGKKFQFRQFHFHSDSEHTVNGEKYPLEMHLVHQEEGTSNLAVLGVFIEEAGADNEFLEKVFSNIPENEMEEEETDVQLSLSDYIPPSPEFYTYIGSLTTPPCTVGVDWILFKEPIAASSEQIQRFTDSHGNSARPVQPLNNRRVLETISQ